MSATLLDGARRASERHAAAAAVTGSPTAAVTSRVSLAHRFAPDPAAAATTGPAVKAGLSCRVTLTIGPRLGGVCVCWAGLGWAVLGCVAGTRNSSLQFSVCCLGKYMF